MRSRPGFLPACRVLTLVRWLTLAGLAMPAGLPAAAAADEAPADAQYILAIRLNHVETGQVLPVSRRAGRWIMAREDLAHLPLLPPGGWQALPAEVDLAAAAGFEVDFDPIEQRLALIAPARWLAGYSRPFPRDAIDRPPTPTRGPAGLVFNYDVALAHSRLVDQSNTSVGQLAAATEWRWFDRGAGVLHHTHLHRFGGGAPDGRWRGDSVRLDTQWSLAVPDRMLRWRVGDTVTEGGTGLRPIRMGGIQFGTDFDLQPYRPTTVLPAYFGEVALPSTVDLFIDGMRRYSGRVQPGAFAFEAIPGVSGSGQATIVVTDALGRTRTIDFPFYASQRLLLPGLTQWSVSAGLARLAYGQDSFRYDDRPIVSGRLRQGLTRTLTLEGAFEAMPGVQSAGLMAVWAPGQLGVLSPRLGGSHAREPGTAGPIYGSQVGLGYEWSNRRFALHADRVRNSDAYRDLAIRFGARLPRETDRFGLGLGLGQRGNLSLSWLRQTERDGSQARFLTGSWYQRLGPNWAISLSLTRSLQDSDESLAMLAVSRVMGPRRTASFSHTLRHGGDFSQVSLNQPMMADDRDSWRLQAGTGPGAPALQAEAAREWTQWRGQLNAYTRADQLTGWASAQGAIVAMAGHVKAARAIPDAFALVSTDRVAGVGVQLENRLVGRTDADGLLLVTPLHGWMANRLSVDALALPPDIALAEPVQSTVARGRAGSLVRFPMRKVKAATIRLTDPTGAPVPMGAQVLLNGGRAPPGRPAPEPAWVGYDGEIWFEGLVDAGNRVEVSLPGGQRCMARFDYPEGEQTPARIDPLVCQRLPARSDA